jgi:hydroxymethylpyrimidine/phosphomethylpyrimidine kinase
MSLKPPVALSIAGSDSGAGAGIQADLLTFAALGVFGTTALTCVTAQNPDSVTDVEALRPELVREQILQVDRFFRLGAVKTGMLFNTPIINSVAAFFQNRPNLPKVVDPVMVATSGAVLLQEDAIEALKERILPQATLVTPNADEAGVLIGDSPRGPDEARHAALELAARFGTAFLLKGGHLEGDLIVDILAFPDGACMQFASRRIINVDTHGSGCTLSAAIAARLALGDPLDKAVSNARDFLSHGLRNPVEVGSRRFIAHHAPAHAGA